MAINPTYSHTDTIAKVKFGDKVYYMKDLDLRNIVNNFGNATAQDVATSIADGGTGLATSDLVYDFVLDQIGGLGTVLNLLAATDHTAVTDPAKGDFVVESDGKEWLYDGAAWREVGDETAYVHKTAQIAGIDLQDDITAAELKTALGLAALAYAATASVTVDDYATGITGASYTPAGSVTIAADEDGTQVSGTNAASAVTITPSTGTFVTGVKTAAVAPSFTEGTFTPASLTKDQVNAATEGVVVSIDEEDSEMLVFTAANTSSVSNVTAFDGGSKTADTFSAGSAAEFNTADAWTGYTAAEAAAQTFTGDKFKATFSGTNDTITPTLNKGSKKITVSPDAAS